MRRALFAMALTLVVGTAALAAENQAFLGIFAETSSQKIAGMPAMPELPPGIQLPEMPGMPSLAGMGRPQRLLTVRLWSPGIAPEDATAAIAPPAGLKQGDRLDLELYRPKPEKVEGGAAEGIPDPDSIPDFTIKRYWGSSATVKPGQPQIIRWDGLTAEQKAAMREEAKKAQQTDTYFYKPDWTTGYWPTRKQPGRIAPDASLAGTYRLTSTYTGSVSIDVPENVEFLAPIEMTSPRLDRQVPLAQALRFRWKAIPNLLGSHARIIGMEGKNTLIIWSSAEIPTDMNVDWDYMQMADVRKNVASTAMMAGDRTDVTVPAGIFEKCDFVSFQMVGFGPGAALPEGQPLPRVQTKTTLSIMLGGKSMAGMGEEE